jgi:hypothetical protein
VAEAGDVLLDHLPRLKERRATAMNSPAKANIFLYDHLSELRARRTGVMGGASGSVSVSAPGRSS